MSREQHDRQVDYVEFPATDIAATKKFYEGAFGWRFQDYGPDYVSFEDGRLSGGFYRAPQVVRGAGALVVIYSTQLEQARERVLQAGGTIAREIFSFPGGRRFHFADPGGNELAVWTDLPPQS